MATTPTPLHYFDLGTNQYTEHARYPFRTRTPTRLLVRREQHAARSATAPTLPASTTTLVLVAGRQPVRTSDRPVVGGRAVAGDRLRARRHAVRRRRRLERAARARPHDVHDRTAREARRRSPGRSTSPSTRRRPRRTPQWVAEVEDVAPDGTSTPLTEGALLGSLRHVAPNGTWRGRTGRSCCRTTRTRSAMPAPSCRAS